jgi:hypothetical protein
MVRVSAMSGDAANEEHDRSAHDRACLGRG